MSTSPHDDAGIAESDIAIIGMAGRFPGAPDIDTFWRNLCEGRDTVRWFSEEELVAAGAPAAVVARPDFVRANQVLDDADLFDADYFGIPRHEAEIIDPQQRLLLECAEEVLHQAGYDPARYAGAIGVFAGVGHNTYFAENLAERYRRASTVERYQLMLASDKDFVATRISYRLNLRGPSLHVGTACSTSLVALHLACLTVMAGQCDMALVGAASVRFPQTSGYLYQEGMILAPDGHCRAFDADARGTVLGDGAAMVLVKRLADAVADGDTVLAVIKASAINNDGALKGGYTAPSVEGQAGAISDALALSGAPPETIGYVEAHGTGTHLGDPVEVAALTQAFGRWTGRRQYCGLGSVKTNIGHLDVAAGLAGLIKAVLMLRHATLVPSLHFQRPNPEIAFAESPFFVVDQLRPWPAGDTPRRACVSAFGIGGTNAHVVLEAAPDAPPPSPGRGDELLLLSARTAGALQRTSLQLGRHLRAHPQISLRDVAGTLAAGRPRHAYRRALVCHDARDAALSLALAETAVDAPATSPPRLALLVCADPRIGDEDAPLAERLPEWADARAAAVAAFRTAGAASGEADPGIAGFIAAYAEGRFWLQLGVSPKALVGVGPGELVAACLAGSIGLETAARIFLDVRAQATAAAPTTADSPTIPLASATAGVWRSLDDLTTPSHWPTVLTAADTLHWDWPIWRDFSLVVAVGGRGRLAEPSPASLRLLGVDDSNLEARWTNLLNIAGEIWLAGVPLDAAALHGVAIQRVPLPSAPFDRRRYFVDFEGASAPIAQHSALLLALRAAEPSARVRRLATHLQQAIADMVGLASDELPPLNRSLIEMGLDSLILIELASKTGLALNISIPASRLVEFPTINALAAHVVGRLEWDQTPPQPKAEPIAAPHATPSPNLPELMASAIPITGPTPADPEARRQARRHNLWTA